MNSKLTTIILSVLLICTLGYSYYSYNKLSQLSAESKNWQSKYEEALIDMEEAFKRLEEKEVELEKALEEAEKQKEVAESAMKGKK